jgi:hypothetical protein
MTDRSEKEGLLERDLARILPVARTPSVPPLPAGFGKTLAARACCPAPEPSDLPLLVSGISAVCLLALALLLFHRGLPQELRLLAGSAVAANVVLGPIATLAVILFQRKNSHAKA